MSVLAQKVQGCGCSAHDGYTPDNNSRLSGCSEDPFIAEIREEGRPDSGYIVDVICVRIHNQCDLLSLKDKSYGCCDEQNCLKQRRRGL